MLNWILDVTDSLSTSLQPSYYLSNKTSPQQVVYFASPHLLVFFGSSKIEAIDRFELTYWRCASMLAKNSEWVDVRIFFLSANRARILKLRVCGPRAIRSLNGIVCWVEKLSYLPVVICSGILLPPWLQTLTRQSPRRKSSIEAK